MRAVMMGLLFALGTPNAFAQESAVAAPTPPRKATSMDDLLKRVRQENPNAMVILNTGFPTTSLIIEAMKYGAYDVLHKERLAFEVRTVEFATVNDAPGVRCSRARLHESAK